MAKKLTHWINGKHIEGTSGRFGDVYNPATGEVESQVPLASETEVTLAVAAAKGAFPSWSAAPPLARARVMFKYKTLIEDNAEVFAENLLRQGMLDEKNPSDNYLGGPFAIAPLGSDAMATMNIVDDRKLID